MDVYIYQADLYCEDCGKSICQKLKDEGKAPEMPDDEHTYDSDEFPKGPYSDGGGESDGPHHCAAGDDCINAIEIRDTKVGAFLENDLTADGIAYIEKMARNDPGSSVVRYWLKTYREMGYDLPEPVAHDFHFPDGIDIDELKRQKDALAELVLHSPASLKDHAETASEMLDMLQIMIDQYEE